MSGEHSTQQRICPKCERNWISGTERCDCDKSTDQQASHSAAPWRFIASDERILANDGCIVVYELNSNEADGRLIAAAPDLLEALKELLASQLAIMPPFQAGKEAQDAWADCRAKGRNNAATAIAKAEGRS